MKITVINNDTKVIVPCPDGTSCLPGKQREMTGRTQSEIQLLVAFQSANIIVRTELEAVDREPIVASMSADATATGGATTKTGVGTQLKSQAGTSVSLQPDLYVGCFDDVACTVPAVDATLATAASGTIVSGGASNLLVVTPSATGAIALTMTNAEDTVVYVKVWPVGTTYTIDSSGTQAITFEA